MFFLLASTLVMFSPPETPVITFSSTLAGGPKRIAQSLQVSCGETTYMFRFEDDALRDEVSIEFDRSPEKPSEKLSTEVIEAFRQFYGVPLLEAWCPARSADQTVDALWLEATGQRRVSDKEAHENCIMRGGMFSPNSWRRITIEDDAVYVDGDETGKCTTKEDIDKYNRQHRDSVK